MTKSPLFDEIRDDIFHLLLHVYVYQDKSARINNCSPTRYDIASELVALNAVAESITLRVARLADQSKSVRSFKNLFKKTPSVEAGITRLFEEFERVSQPVLRQRHDRIAHMKVGEVSSYPISPLTHETLRCVEVIVNLFDDISNRKVGYFYKVGSQEKAIDLRQSVMQGCRVKV